MKLSELQGITRASLFLAISYLETQPKVGIEELDKCEDIVAAYLYNNGLKFNFINNWNSMIIPHRITLLANTVRKKDIPYTEALDRLGKRVRLKMY